MMPLRCFPGAAFFVSCGWIIPFAVDLQRTTADVAIRRVPGAVFMVIRNVVPVFMVFD